MTHRSRAFNVAIDQENTAAISRRGQTLQAKTPAPSSRTGLQDVKRLAQSTAGPQTRVLGKQDSNLGTNSKQQSKILLQDKTNKAREGPANEDAGAKPKCMTSPKLNTASLPAQMLRTPSPNMHLIKQRAPEPTPGPNEAELERQRLEEEALRSEAEEAMFKDMAVELPASNTAEDMEFSDEFLGIQSFNTKETFNALWCAKDGIEEAVIESDPPIAIFEEVDWLSCRPLPPSPESKPWSTQPRTRQPSQSYLRKASSQPMRPATSLSRTPSTSSSRPTSSFASQRPATSMRTRQPSVRRATSQQQPRSEQERTAQQLDLITGPAPKASARPQVFRFTL